MNKKIDAIIINYRNGDLTTRCVDSLSRQVARVWVVDNSADKTHNENLFEKIKALQAKNRYVKVVVENPGTNLGFAKGMQLGIDKALAVDRQRLIIVINNDAIAGEGMIDSMIQGLNAFGGKALVAPSGAKGSTPSMLWYHRLFALVLTHPLPGAFPYLSGACLLAPASFARPYLFDTDFFMYGEDVELSWRMAQAGVPMVVADTECKHAGSASSRLGSLFYEYHVARGHILLAYKLAKGPLDRSVLLIGRAISLPLRASVRCIRFMSLTPWRALVRAWLGKPPPHPEA